MAVEAQHSPPAQAPGSEDIIDLGYYLGVLVAWWKEILLIGLLTALVAGVGYWLIGARSPALFSSAADVAIARTVSELNFDERFTTTSENTNLTIASPRRNALLALAVNPALAVEVIAQMGDALPEELSNPGSLAKAIAAASATGTARNGDSDLIRITASAESPDVAAQIATTWARAYVRNVNAVFGQAPDELLASMTEERAQAEAAYDTTQSTLETFVAESRIDELTRQIADQEAVVNALRRGRQNTFNSLVDSSVQAVTSVAAQVSSAHAATAAGPILAEEEGKQALLQAYLETVYGSQQEVFSQQARRDQELLAGYYTRWLQVTRSLDEARTLRAQVDAGEENLGGGNALVLSLLKLQAFTQATDPQTPPQLDLSSAPVSRVVNTASEEQAAAAAPSVIQSAQPVQVQVSATPLQIQLDDQNAQPKAALLAEIDALVATLGERRTELEMQIADLGEQMKSGTALEVPDALLASQGALALAIRDQAPVILSQAVLTGTLPTTDARAGASIGMEALAQLYRLDDLQAIADGLSQEQPLDAAIAGLEAELRQLHAQLEAEESRQTQLTRERDLARDALETVGRKIAELTLSRAAASSEVRFAAPGVAPVRPIEGISPLIIAAVGALLGLVLGVIVAFVADYLGRPPFLTRRRAATAG